jgi:hypothetical protein
MVIGKVDLTPEKCLKCEREITPDDMGIYRKLINRDATKFFCAACLARELDTTEEELRERIDFFKKQGCTLFI